MLVFSFKKNPKILKKNHLSLSTSAVIHELFLIDVIDFIYRPSADYKWIELIYIVTNDSLVIYGII